MWTGATRYIADLCRSDASALSLAESVSNGR
jgi:hypothetical protein